MSNRFQRVFFAGTSQLTHNFPRTGAWLLDSTLLPITASRMASQLMFNRNRRIVKEINSFRRFLVNPDTHIGDTIMAQSVVLALREFFPDAEIDCVTNKSANGLVWGNPEVTRFIPVYSSSALPSEADLKKVRELIEKGDYDLCINICPFIKGKGFADSGSPILDFVTHAPVIIRNECKTSEINHFSYQCYRFVRELLSEVAEPVRSHSFGLRVTLSDDAIESASQFMKDVPSDSPIIMMNTDTASPYTRIPYLSQAKLLREFAEKGHFILVGEGHTDVGVGNRLVETLPSGLRQKARVIPSKMSLETYSALTDLCDVFVTGDTGPMHIAAARKFSRSGKYTPRNRTSVLSIFGATPPRMSGYDSFKPGYLLPNQDAPSWCIQAKSTCRNISCVNKLYKTCTKIGCFEEIDLDNATRVITAHLKTGDSLAFEETRVGSPRLQ